jgi:NAD(P)-dependent dehydrogenase (short-subunit alcohol dehydrogenase family)
MNQTDNNLFDLTDRVAVVTGASSGLGQAMAIGLAQHGAHLAICCDKNMEGLAETAATIESHGQRALQVQCDTSQADEVGQFFEQVDAAFGQVDVLVNNVGAPARFRPEEMPFEDWDRVLQVNITSTFLCAQEAGQRMMARQSGSIINISSTASVTGMGRGNFAYGTTKGAVNELTRELAVEWARYGIRVNALLPAQVLTPYLEQLLSNPSFSSGGLMDRIQSGIPLGRLGNTADLVGPVVFLASDASAFISGAMLPVDGGNLAFNPCGSLEW